MGFLLWLKETPLVLWARGSDWPHPILLCLHALGMATVVGIAIVVAVRALGFAAAMPIPALERPMRLAWLGFYVNAISGVLLFALNGPAYIQNAPFLIKMGLIMAGGTALYALWRRLQTETAEADGKAASATARVLALATLFLWAAAILAGRLIAYVMDAGRAA